jgi:hypothetical protein
VEHSRLIAIGIQVEVRNQYLGTWNGGFEVVDVTDDGYIIRRRSDGIVLPTAIAFDDVRMPEGLSETLWSASYKLTLRRRATS